MFKSVVSILIYFITFILAAGGCTIFRNSRQPESITEENTKPPVTDADEFKNIKFNIYDNNKIPDDVEVMMDIEYGKGGNKQLKLNIIRPKRQIVKPLPVILWVHGGGWESGNKNDQNGMLAGFAQQGYFCASIQYRLSNEAIFPAQLEDCKSAVRFLRANAKKYNIDPDKIGAWGASAGGHLVSLLGTTGEIKEFEGSGGSQEFPSNIQAVCDWFGPVAFGNAVLPSDNSISKLIGGTPQDYRERAIKADPITYVTPDDSPILIMHGDKDTIVPYELSQIFNSVLKGRGVNATLYIVKDADHWFVNMAEFQMVLEFFNRQLK